MMQLNDDAFHTSGARHPISKLQSMQAFYADQLLLQRHKNYSCIFMLIADEDFQRIELLLSINSIFYPKEESMEIFYGYGLWLLGKKYMRPEIFDQNIQ